MQFDPDRHHRRSIRLPGFDYSEPGAYFVTICVQDRECLLGAVVGAQVELSALGEIARACWVRLPEHYHHVVVDTFVVMPNHLHAIVVLEEDALVGAGLKPAPTDVGRIPRRHALSEVVRAFKTFSAREINRQRGTPALRFWQRNYYEHIVRDDQDLDRIREYVLNNPAHWSDDPENPMSPP